MWFFNLGALETEQKNLWEVQASILGQPGLHSEILPQKKSKKKERKGDITYK